MQLVRIFIAGMVISWLGTIPLGALNLSALQISVSDGIQPAFYFAIGAMLVEMVYVRLSLVAMDRLTRKKEWLVRLEWVMVLVILSLAAASFYTAYNPQVEKNPILTNTIHRFWLGTMMSAVNPVQIPFWFGWSTVLYGRKWLKPLPQFFAWYILGIGIGTLAGNSLFIFGGRLLVNKLKANQDVIHISVGIIFLLTALFYAWKLLRHQDAISRLPDTGQSDPNAGSTS